MRFRIFLTKFPTYGQVGTNRVGAHGCAKQSCEYFIQISDTEKKLWPIYGVLFCEKHNFRLIDVPLRANRSSQRNKSNEAIIAKCPGLATVKTASLYIKRGI